MAASRNRTLVLNDEEAKRLRGELADTRSATSLSSALNRTFHADCLEALPLLPKALFHLLILDPPYNKSKKFGETKFLKRKREQYGSLLERWLDLSLPLLRADASVYICSDWQTSSVVEEVARSRLHVHNRITWEREKGRGATRNWKSATEDLWFCSVSANYRFFVERVRLMRRVRAPYRRDGKPRDWQETAEGGFRSTYPSNCWTDLTVPFWSMPENTVHPTQKPEKLFARILLSSTEPGDLVLDPFAGSGTTGAVATKLNRQFVQIESELEYACLAEKRVQLARDSQRIQGYEGSVFWERNSVPWRASGGTGGASG